MILLPIFCKNSTIIYIYKIDSFYICIDNIEYYDTSVNGILTLVYVFHNIQQRFVAIHLMVTHI